MPFHFWYIYATTGTDGFLLDLERRPDEAVARLTVFRAGCPPQIVRCGFDPGELTGNPGELGVRLNRIALDALGCRGGIPEIDLEACFALNGRSMSFVPRPVTWWFDQIPDFRSHYGICQEAVCRRAVYSGVPLVCSTYSIENLSAAKWVLISALRFPDSDLAFEISAGRLLGRWMPTAWVYFGGREYHFNSALDPLLSIRMGKTGDLECGERVFTASIHGKGIRFEVEARAGTADFARLDVEGQTEIHTTLFGSCRASALGGPIAGKSFQASRTCLLEVKS